MGLFSRVIKTAGWVLYDNLEDILNITLVPKVGEFVTGKVTEKLGEASSKWLVSKIISKKAIDGAILRGINTFRNSGAKFAIRKGLPDEGSRVLAIENEPHILDGFDGVIPAGYGKGTKKIVYKGKAILKVAGVSRVTDIEYHVHQADKAGLHYDLAIRGLNPDESLFELNIGKGPVKGRYSFVKTDRGFIVGQMKDRGLSIVKPTYNLKQEEFLEKMSNDPALADEYIVERKMDGSLANVYIHEDRAILHSHRESASSYYDKLPSLEFLRNSSRFFLSRKIFPSSNLNKTVLKVELVHPDGASIVSGILNSSADNAIRVQKKIGNVKAYAWDIVKLNGKDISGLPYEERRMLLEGVIDQIKIFNPNWEVIEKRPDKLSPIDFYTKIVNDKRGLPWSEGVVIKSKSATAEDSWLKVKTHDLVDMTIIGFRAGKEGRLSETLGSIVAKDIKTGNIAVVGTGLSDFQRDWIWDHKEMLNGAVIKARVFEETENSFRAPRFVEFHESKGDNEYGLQMQADLMESLEQAA